MTTIARSITACRDGTHRNDRLVEVEIERSKWEIEA
jgi:hypothetical protein